MVGRLIQTTKSAYQYPLIFKQLWHTPRVQAPDQEVVYRDLKRFTYRADQGAHRPSGFGACSDAGVQPGDTVGVLDWDSNRFLEAFFAIPMMGAVLQTVNVRLSPEQIAYTIDHAGASTLLVNDEFVGLVEGLKAAIAERQAAGRDVGPAVRRRPAGCRSSANMRALLAAASPRLRLSRFRREHAGDDVLHDRHDRAAEGRLLQPSAARAAYALPSWRSSASQACRAASRATTSTCRSRRCSTSTPGVSRGRRRSPASSRSIPAATSRRCWSS